MFQLYLWIVDRVQGMNLNYANFNFNYELNPETEKELCFILNIWFKIQAFSWSWE